MKRILGAVLTLPLLAVPATGVVHAASARTASAQAAAGAVLDHDTLIRRCLPQLKAHGEVDGVDQTLKPLTLSTAAPAKPLVDHRAGDLVAFLGQAQGTPDSRVDWVRMDTLCKVPDTEPEGAPGSAPLPASETSPSKADRARDLQLCTEAPDVTGFFSAQPYDLDQVVVPDVRPWRLGSEAWSSTHVGIQTLADENDGYGAICGYGIYGGTTVQSAQPTVRLRPFDYDNGYPGHPDRYYAAGFVPSDANNAHPVATTIAVTPPGQKTQRFPVRTTGMAGNGGVGSYAIAMSFTRVTAPLGQKHTAVKLLTGTGKVVWSGTWDVGIEGH